MDSVDFVDVVEVLDKMDVIVGDFTVVAEWM